MLQADYIHRDDYDPADVEWIECTTIGSPFRVQIDAAKVGHHRYRPSDGMRPWQAGDGSNDKENRITHLIARLMGSSTSMETECEDLGLDPMDDEVTGRVDGEVFNCTDCNWWCDISEEASEKVDHDEWICAECAENY